MVIEDYEIEIEAGMFVKLDCNSCSRQLLAGDDFCQFRLESSPAFRARSVYAGSACRIEVTGRKIDWRDKSVRCQVVFIGDGEPDERCPAKLYLKR